MANLGGVLPSIIGPQIVTDPLKESGDIYKEIVDISKQIVNISKEIVAHQIYNYMLMYFILALVLFCLFICHFPESDYVNEEAPVQNAVIPQCIKLLS